jgi:tetratricopeptide (TPR) repeat protein
MRARRRRVPLVLLVLLVLPVLPAASALLAGEPAASAATDPFYVDLLRDGITSYDRGEFAAAAKRLRLACFGLLDDPQALAACLTRLAAAQGAGGDSDAFRETFRRIADLEERFAAYTRAELPPEIRTAFEQRAAAIVPAATLEAVPAFKDLLSRKLETQLAALPPRERRRQLEERLAKDPKNPTLNVLLADLDLGEGNVAPALARLDQVLALAPRDARALCVRGLARASAKRCAEAVPDLEGCWMSGRELRYGAALLGCRVERGEWRQAEEQVRALPPAWKEDRRVAALVQQVAKHQGATTAPTAGSANPGGTSAVAAPGAAPARGGGAGSPAGTSGTGTIGGGAGASATGGAGVRSGGATTTGGGGGMPPSGSAGAARNGAAVVGGTAAGGSPRGGAASPGGLPGGGAPGAPGSAAASRGLSAAERETVAKAERLLTATTSRDLQEALRLARQVADAHPDAREVQYLAGEAAYRNSRWADAAVFFKRGGAPGDDRPELLFYMAVALYEVGDQPGAAAALRRSLPNLQKTPYVEGYVKRILGQ